MKGKIQLMALLAMVFLSKEALRAERIEAFESLGPVETIPVPVTNAPIEFFSYEEEKTSDGSKEERGLASSLGSVVLPKAD